MLGQNIVTCTSYEPDFDALRAASTRIVLAAGEESEGEMAHRGAEAVAERLGTTPVAFPSDHAGFLGGEYGQTGKPDEFAARLARSLQRPDVALGGNLDRLAAGLGRVLEAPLVGPATALVELPGASVARHDREPRTTVAGRSDPAFGVGDECVGHPEAAVWGRDVDLLELVGDDHREPDHLPAHHGHRHVRDSLGGAPAERGLVAECEKGIGHVAEVAIPPARVPDSGDRRRVAPFERSAVSLLPCR